VPKGTAVTSLDERRTQYLSLSDALKRLPGEAFEDHDHPAVLLDRVAGPSVRVWGWWTPGTVQRPCLLWCGDAGWSATVVEPVMFDPSGYELRFWTHRIQLLDVALANALGPYPTLEDLEVHVAAESSFGIGPESPRLRRAVLWGIFELRAARARARGHVRDAVPLRDFDTHGGRVDAELAKHALSPSVPKPRLTGRRKHKDPAVGAVVRALRNLRSQD